MQQNFTTKNCRKMLTIMGQFVKKFYEDGEQKMKKIAFFAFNFCEKFLSALKYLSCCIFYVPFG